MLHSEEITSTPVRLHRDFLPSSPDNRFSSPSLFSINSWTPVRTPLWPSSVANGGNGTDASSPGSRFVSFTTPGSLDLTPSQDSGPRGDSCKRGRPRADLINHLIHQGSSSPNGIKCKVCGRVFPREKSLQAHLRTHTGERPYVCDYPNCTKTFTQSGQLKTHQRLHAGEKPFVCSAPGCTNRYTHANRTCPLHPQHKVHRSNDLFLQPILGAGEDPNEVARWLDNYRRERAEKTPAKNELGTTAEAVTSTTTMTTVPSMSLPSLPLNLLTTSPFSVSIRDVVVDDCDDSDAQAAKRLKTKRGLASQLEQETSGHGFESSTPTSTSMPTANQFSLQARPSPGHVRSIPAPMLPRSPLKSFDTNNVHRQVLGDITPRKNVAIGVDNNFASSSSSFTLTSSTILSPIKRSPFKRRLTSPPSSPVKTLSLKKRWLKEADRDQKRGHEVVPRDDDVENLALPIRWNETEAESPESKFRRSPLAWSAASALVEMAERDVSYNQPLNLSISKRKF